jgi:hypothetical protein
LRSWDWDWMGLISMRCYASAAIVIEYYIVILIWTLFFAGLRYIGVAILCFIFVFNVLSIRNE